MTNNAKGSELLEVSVSPHIKGKRTTQKIMLDVIIALLPAAAAAIIIFGIRVLLLIAVSVLSCTLGELIFNKITKKPFTLSDLSAVVTGMILALNVPASLPLWQLAFGSIAAICMVKGLFGGLGQNFANPAATARVLLLVCFPAAMGQASEVVFADSGKLVSGATDLVSTATPLTLISEGGTLPSVSDMLFGLHGTCAVGETCVIAILIGFIYLLARKVISWHTPVCFTATVYILSLFVTASASDSLYLVMSGGLLFGAVFMATDYATTPTSYLGKAVFGIGCGLITVLIRSFGSYPEGVSLSILLMNILTPYIERLCRRRPFGGVKQ